MNQRLFQDAGGTTPAIIAGQPVGLIKRLAGSVDAVQATALSKPTLARHPKGGIRNLASWAQNPSSHAGWGSTTTNNGVTATKVSSGVDPVDGVPYVDFRYVGTATSSSISNAYRVDAARVAATQGQNFTTRVDVSAISGSLVGVEGIKNAVAIEDASMVYIGEIGKTTPVSLGEYVNIAREGTIALSGATYARPSVVLVATVGIPIDVTMRYKGLQFERGLERTPLQFNYGPNDITEQGVGDLWHLYNDGGDSLNVTLPAGTYGLASIDINRAITITTITSDGTTPINTLRHERQLDVILRAGAFSSGEETAIRDYWGRVFA